MTHRAEKARLDADNLHEGRLDLREVFSESERQKGTRSCQNELPVELRSGELRDVQMSPSALLVSSKAFRLKRGANVCDPMRCPALCAAMMSSARS